MSDDCERCGGKGYITYGSDTEGGRRTVICDCCFDVGVLYICRDIPGNHRPGPDCWCVPLAVYEDDLRNVAEIVAEIESRNLKQ